MRSILFRLDKTGTDSLTTQLWEEGTAGLIEEPNGLRAFFDDSKDISKLTAQFGGIVIEMREEKPADWQSVSREGWEPVLAGRRFFIVPPWLETVPVPDGRMRIVMDSGMAFGTGRHESTQLAMEALEEYLRPGQTVVDIGCGTGILSQAARMLGAGCAFACDIDPIATDEAQKHLPQRIFTGSADAIRTAAADVIVANLTYPTIEKMGSELWRIVKRGGLVILGGILTVENPAYVQPEEVLVKNEWQCWICRKS